MGDFIEFLQHNARQGKLDNGACEPYFYKLTNPNEQAELTELVQQTSQLKLIDEIELQLAELIKLNHPKKKFTPDQLKKAIEAHLNGTPIEQYGQWVYYPWLNKLIHVLPEDEFITVRTNRNHYKITPEEEAILAGKKIGIIGLSVGKSIALTIALERICGELILADFDVIELSNLNRIQTGVQNFGLKKTVVVAREIAEIDPYLTVKCFHDGLTEDNVDDFFTEGGQLDICIEVCDGLHTKIFARQKAKELKIPVVMNSSDRGTTDIERFDLEPDLPLLHGLIDHLDLTLVKQAKTNEEKVPYLLPMLGVETSSDRLKASMLEIQETITTWPQLASGVVFGGGICTDVCRRILLNQFTQSGRYFVDIEEAVNDEVDGRVKTPEEGGKSMQSAPFTSFTEFNGAIETALDELQPIANAVDVSQEVMEEIVSFACLAPSGGNMQPWKWVYKQQQLFLFIDPSRTSSVLNYENIAANIGLGAASKNLQLKAADLGYNVLMEKQPLANHQNLLAIFHFEKEGEPSTLGQFIPQRMTNRKVTATGRLNKEEINSMLKAMPVGEHLSLKLIEERSTLDELKQLMIQVDKLYYTSKLGHESFVHEMRWTPAAVDLTKDGIDLNTIDLTPTERAGFMVSQKWDVVRHLNQWNLGAAYGNLTAKGVDSASALGVMVGPEKINPINYFEAGRMIQELWLTATSLNLAFQPMSISAFLFARAGYDESTAMDDLKVKLLEIEKEFKQTIGWKDDERMVFLFRLTKADDHSTRSLRRELSEVFLYER